MATEQWDMLSFEYGTVALVAREGRVCRVVFSESQAQAADTVLNEFPNAVQSSQKLLQDGFQQLTEYFHGKRRDFTMNLDRTALSAFARKVHKVLDKVPYGSVISYGELAAQAGHPGAARAVGSVMSSNPFPLFVPCHRVVNANGAIGNYSGGSGRRTKIQLIDFERNQL